MRILLLGGTGQVGGELESLLAPLGDVHTPSRRDLDLTDTETIRKTVRALRPELIVNAAAYTSVDWAETEPDVAMAVNGTGPRILAEEGKRISAGFVHYSTDYVFNGRKTRPYSEDDQAHPLNSYGRSKYSGDLAIEAVNGAYLILRTGWVYGLRRRSFLILWDNRPASSAFGRRETWQFGASRPGGAVIPPGVVHAYRNIGGVDGLSLNLPDDLYQGTGKQSPVDEIRHERDAGSPFQMPPV